MLAAIKRGKKFENEGSTTWVLQSAETIEASSALGRLVDNAKKYLQRVVDDHPGTPWALVAERELAMPIVACRAGDAEPDFGCLAGLVRPQRIDQIRRHRIDSPRIELSSTEIRRRVAKGSSIRYRTPRAVEKYIQTHGLYV